MMLYNRFYRSKDVSYCIVPPTTVTFTVSLLVVLKRGGFIVVPITVIINLSCKSLDICIGFPNIDRSFINKFFCTDLVIFIVRNTVKLNGIKVRGERSRPR